MKIIKRLSFIVLVLLLPAGAINAQTSKSKKPKKTSETKKTEPLKPAKEIHWITGAEPAFEDSAYKHHKPAILYVYQDEGEASPAFYKTVLSDTNIINYIDSNFMAYKLDLIYDYPNAMKYMLDDVPAVVLLDRKNTKMIDKMEGLHSVAEFKKFLKQAVR